MYKNGKPTGELTLYLASIMVILSLSVDMVLPALKPISEQMLIEPSSNRQLLISLFFFAFAVGQIFYGPVSDSIGRKKTLYFGLVIFFVGCVLSALAKDFQTLLFSRVLQGLGCASVRVMCFAIARDAFDGRDLVSKFSTIWMIFIIAPILAPSIGQILMTFFHSWQSIFIVTALAAFVVLLWTHFRLRETLKPQYKRPFTLRSIAGAFKNVIQTPQTMIYSTAAGLMFGAQLYYVSSSELIIKEIFHRSIGEFGLVFAYTAFFIGFGNFVNGRLVHRLGIHFMTHFAMLMSVVVSVIFLAMVYLSPGLIPFSSFIVIIPFYFFFYAIALVNFNSLAIYPLPHIAGTASTFIGFYMGVLASGLSMWASSFYNATLLPYALFFFGSAVVSFLLIYWLEGKKMFKSREPETLKGGHQTVESEAL